MSLKLNINAGDKYGRLTIISEYGKNKNKRRLFLCKCTCGNRKITSLDLLRRGSTISCGCYKSERLIALNNVHGESNSREFKIWQGIKRRCTATNNKNYPDYGGRGISMSKDWMIFSNFLLDMGRCPDGHTLERIDNNKNYEKNNCIWADRKVQANNTRRNVFLEFNGKTKTVAQWCDEFHIPYSRVHARIKLGWGIDRIFTCAPWKREW